MPNLLFDLDGTLVNSQPGIEYALRSAVQDVLPSRLDALGDLSRIIGPPVATMFKRALAGITEQELSQLVARFRHYYDEAGGWQKTLVYSGVVSTLQQLLELNWRCFVVTNKPALATSRILMHLDLARFFEVVTSPDSLTQSRFSSKVEMVSYLILNYHLEATQTYLIGDSLDDAQAALQNGLQFIVASYGYGEINQPASQTVELKQFSDLSNILKSVKAFA